MITISFSRCSLEKINCVKFYSIKFGRNFTAIIINNNNKLISAFAGSSAPSCSSSTSVAVSNSCPHESQVVAERARLHVVAGNICCSYPKTSLHSAHWITNNSLVKQYKFTQFSRSSNSLVQNFKREYSQNQQLGLRKMAKIISGKDVSNEIRSELKIKVESLGLKPKLAIVQVGGREDSNVYIKMKIQFAESIGASAELFKLAREVTESELAHKVQQLNEDPTIHGIITQLPFDTSSKIDSDKIVNLIDPKKDVDGLCVYNAGKLLHGELTSSSFIPCTPNGCMKLIEKSGIKLEGTRSVVIGRSKIVGSPMAQLLVWNNSTVTICHSRTKNLDEICRQADIVVAAVGRAQMVKASWLKPGAVVIDCGINVIPDSTKKSGTRLVGDVDFDDCKEVASAITPVPGGVGPMTVAMLISNTVEAAERASRS